MTKFAMITLTVFAIAGSGAATASATTLSCGDVVTTDVTLAAPIVGCDSVGLTIAADGVTVDLNGHSIQGVDGTVGISASGRTGVTVKNGTIEGLQRGRRIRRHDIVSRREPSNQQDLKPDLGARRYFWVDNVR